MMTYEEKFDIVVKAVWQARNFTIKGYHTKLKITKENGLKNLDPDEIASILFKLQEYKIIKMVSTAKANFLTGPGRLEGESDFYALEILDDFEKWYENYLIEQKSKPKNLDWINLLKIYDVCIDINQQLQITKSPVVSIPSFPYPYIGRFLELFPYDSIGTRKTYQNYRREGAQYLLKKGIALEINYKDNDLSEYDKIIIKIDPVKFDDFYKTIKAEFEKRKKSFEDKDKSETNAKVDATVKKEATWHDDFRWEGNTFVFGKYGSISFISKQRKHILKVLTDKKGGWATINELKGDKDAGYVRSTIKQIEDRLSDEAKKHIKIVSTQEDDSLEKPNQGAYRIKVKL